METLPSKSQGNNGLSTSTLSTVLREIPKAEVLNTIGDLLDKIAKLYQVPNWDALNTVLLSEWIVDNYPSDSLKTVIRCLSRQRSTEKNWRLTPDTIREWMTFELGELSEVRETYIQNKKYADGPNEWTDEKLNELRAAMGPVVKSVIPLTEAEIREEGQEKPKKPKYTYTDMEYFIMNQKRVEYGRLYTHPHSGDILPGSPSFEEFLLMKD